MALSGRPPKDPMKKVSRPVRALVTPPVEKALIQAAQFHGIQYKMSKSGIPTVPSDILRLYMVNGLKKDGLWDKEMEVDPTFEYLRQAGLA